MHRSLFIIYIRCLLSCIILQRLFFVYNHNASLDELNNVLKSVSLILINIFLGGGGTSYIIFFSLVKKSLNKNILRIKVSHLKYKWNVKILFINSIFFFFLMFTNPYVIPLFTVDFCRRRTWILISFTFLFKSEDTSSTMNVPFNIFKTF